MSKLNQTVVAGLETSESTLADIARSMGPAANASEKAAELRKTRRRPLNGLTEKLKVYGEVPGYHLHIANDDGNRLVEVQAAGYDFVSSTEITSVNGNLTSFNTDAGGRVRYVVGTDPQGEPMYGYLMKIPQELFEEDQLELEKRNQQVDLAIRSGHYNEKPNERRYIPATGITMDSRLYRPS